MAQAASQTAPCVISRLISPPAPTPLDLQRSEVQYQTKQRLFSGNLSSHHMGVGDRVSLLPVYDNSCQQRPDPDNHTHQH